MNTVKPEYNALAATLREVQQDHQRLHKLLAMVREAYCDGSATLTPALVALISDALEGR